MRLFFTLILFFTSVRLAQAHAVPDIPVRSYFNQDGSCTITIEIDPRCFAADPNTEPSLLNAVLPSMDDAQRASLKAKAAELARRYVEFFFDPSGPVIPEFRFDFTGHARLPLRAEDDVVVLTGICEIKVPPGSTAWRIRATKETPLAVVFRNFLEGMENPKFSVLFPGEMSFPFELGKAQEPLQHIVFGSCLNVTDHPMLDRAVTLPMELFLFMGDNVYADTTDMKVMRSKYRELSQSAFFQAVRAKSLMLATWDDHDYGVNDGGADYPMRRESQREFLDWLSVPADSPRRSQEGIYQSRSFGPAGKRLQVILLDTRYFRSPLKRVEKEQSAPGGKSVPHDNTSTTILGAAQWQWLEAVLSQPANLRLVVSSIQFAAEASGSESWANFPHEQKRLIKLIEQTRASGVVFLSGDRHWCEFSVLTEGTPYPLFDFTASSMTQVHQRGEPTANRNRVLQKTFHQPNVGTLTIDWKLNDTTLTFGIVDTGGAIQLEKTIKLGDLSAK